jgi:HPt (histidine-containing phosphotransfer) domain-containing protein
MAEHIIDFSLLEQLSGGDPKYKYELLEIFLNTMDTGMDNLQQLAKEGVDYDAVFKQAHALKSSAGIVKIKGIYDGLLLVETMGRDIAEARTTEGKEEIAGMVAQMTGTYQQARPRLVEEFEKNKSAS